MKPTTSPTVNIIFMTSTLPVAIDEGEANFPVEPGHEGDYTGTFRVIARWVVVRFGGEGRFATQDIPAPEVVATRLLRDLSSSLGEKNAQPWTRERFNSNGLAPGKSQQL
jgi:hypothetical protein